LVLPLGDPAGIGAEVTLKALARPWPPGAEITLVGCRQWLEQSYDQLKRQGAAPLADPAELKVVNLPLEEAVRCGHSDAATGAASYRWLTRAAEMVLAGAADALVTAPIAKAS
jgi:4-hydroxythreonine-4-phosphate dehydrogenase